MEFINRLKSIKYPSGQVKWLSLYKCPQCGMYLEKLETTIYKSPFKHCGCQNNFMINWKYGPELKSRWHGMLTRTVNGRFKRPDSYNDGPYKDVKVCDEWNNSFKTYYDWAIKNNFKPHLHMDRKDPKKGYNPDNCRWITQQENNRNGARSKLNTNTVREVMFLYGTYRVVDIARIYGITPPVVINMSTGVIWKDMYKLYGKPRSKEKFNFKFLLPINREVKPGFINFNNKKQLDLITRGYLVFKDDNTYELLNLKEYFNLYKDLDISVKNYDYFFRTIECYYRQPERYEILLRSIHIKRLKNLHDIRSLFKLIFKYIGSSYVKKLNGFYIARESNSKGSVEVDF